MMELRSSSSQLSVSHAKQRDYYQTPAIMVISNIILSKGHDASEQQA